MSKKQVALIVLDGWGYREEKKDNAIAEAKKPNFDRLWQTCPHSLLEASGESLGLPKGQIGNSELGHTTIGAGRIVEQDYVRISKEIESHQFQKKLEFQELFEHVKKHDSSLHVAGLLSPGGIHSHMNHLFEFLKLAKENNINKIIIHVFTDGRDTPPQSGAEYIKELENLIKELGVGKIATVSGRLYAMDRDKRWERLAKTENTMFLAKPALCHTKPSAYVEELYKKEEVDEKLTPFACVDTEGKTYVIEKNDGIFFFNFRPDRMRMITQKMIEKETELNLYILTMTDYGKEYKTHIVYHPVKIESTLGKTISENGLNQAHIAETEKFAHATYFLNCGRETPYPNEKDILVPSPQEVLTYDLAPKMSAEKVADRAIEEINNDTDFIFVNFANADMVGHTANQPAIIIAIEEIDKELGRILEAMNKKGGITIVTADHGNAEINIDQTTGAKCTAHTLSPVPFIISGISGSLSNGTLADIAPTLLQIMNISIPKEMTGKNLLN